MKIGSVDVNVTNVVKLPNNGSNSNNNEINNLTGKEMSTKAKRTDSILQKMTTITEFEKRNLPVCERVVIDAIEKANKAISMANRRLEYSVHERTKEIMVKVVNTETDEIIREIPPEKMLDMVATIWEMIGIIVDERR
jgi:flagellar protein FlaG